MVGHKKIWILLPFLCSGLDIDTEHRNLFPNCGRMSTNTVQKIRFNIIHCPVICNVFSQIEKASDIANIERMANAPYIDFDIPWTVVIKRDCMCYLLKMLYVIKWTLDSLSDEGKGMEIVRWLSWGPSSSVSHFVNCQLSIANCQLPIANCQSNCQLLVSCFLLYCFSKNMQWCHDNQKGCSVSRTLHLQCGHTGCCCYPKRNILHLSDKWAKTHLLFRKLANQQMKIKFLLTISLKLGLERETWDILF